MILGGGDSGIDKQTAKLTEKESGATGYKKPPRQQSRVFKDKLCL
jgi:hypothetical protein